MKVGVTRDGALGSQGAQPRSGHCGMRSGRSLVAVARGVLGERDPERLGALGTRADVGDEGSFSGSVLRGWL